MYFEEAFKKIKTALEKADVKPADGHLAIQVRMTDDDCGGTFYIEQADKQYFAEPYDYYDNDVDVAAGYKSILSLVQGKLDIETALADGTVYAGGNVDAFIAFAKSITPKKTAKKAAAKKTDTKKKPAAKKSTAKKADEKAKKAAKTVEEPKTSAVKTEKAVSKKTEAAKVIKDTKPEKTKETIAKTVEKEVKPEKKSTAKTGK